MERTETKTAPAAERWNSFQFAGVFFSDVEVDPRKREVHFRQKDITSLLQKRFNRRELERIARECERSIVAKDSPVVFAEGASPQPFASFLLEQVNRVLAGGPREV